MMPRFATRPLTRVCFLALTLAVPAAASASPHAAPTTRTLGVDGEWSQFSSYSRSGGFSEASIYDAIGDRIVTLDGGNFSVITERLDQFTLSGEPAWSTLLAHGPRPPVRDESVAVYDATRQRMIVVVSQANDYGAKLEVWALGLGVAPAWTRLSDGATGPAGRSGFLAVCDAPHDHVVVFGGLHSGTGSEYLNDLWSFDLSTATWTELDAAGVRPLARGGYAATFDAANDRMLVLGGLTDQALGPLLNDVWALSLEGIPTWNVLTPSGVTPPPSTRATAIYDGAGQRLILQGGYVLPGGDQNATWSLSLGASPAWTQLDTDGDVPIAQSGLKAIMDPARRRMILTSGNQDFGNVCFALALDGSNHWSKIYARGERPYPNSRALVFTGLDPIRRRYAVLRTQEASEAPDSSGWLFSIDAPGQWQRVPASNAPSPWTAVASLLDPTRQRVIVFGAAGDAQAVALRDTFIWSALPGVTPGPLANRYGSARAYDPGRDRWLVYGGVSNSGTPIAELWSFSLATLTWTQITFSGGPSARFDASMAYDSARDRMVVFGGTENSSYYPPSPPLRDTWVLPLNAAPAWVEIGQGGTFPSLARSAASIVYDSRRDRVVLVGGATDANYNYYRSTFALSMAPASTWTQLTTTNDPDYPQVTDYDAVGDRAVGLLQPYSGIDVQVLQFGSPAAPSIECPADLLAAHFGVNHLDYRVTNNDPAERAIDFRVISGRNWSGFPLSGQAIVPGFATQLVSIGIPIPDSAVAQGAVKILAWPHGSPSSSDSCSHVLGDVTSSTLADFISATFDGGAVHLAWRADDPAARSGAVHRRDETDPWLPIGTPIDAGAGELQYTDASVVAGRRYAYRLGIGPAGAEEFTSTVWVDVPGAALALAGASPNPALDRLMVSFALPSSDRATLELFDLAGRRVDTREVGALGPGPHVVQLGTKSRLSAGLYLARLKQGSRALTAKVCLLGR